MSQHPKVCIRCGADCTVGERWKDRQGRYVCARCAKAPHQEPAGTIPLADEPEPAPPPSHEPRMCAHCGMLLGTGIVICSSCGLDSRTGLLIGTGKPPPARQCTKCGYSLAGLTTPRCPECGTISRRASHRDSAGPEWRADLRREYIRLAIMIVVGLGFAGLVAAARSDFASDIPVVLLAVLLKYAASLVFGVVVFQICSLLWLGFDAPFHLVLLRLAAVYALTDATGAVAGFVPVLFLPLLIVLFVHVGLLVELLDLDFYDAALVGFFTFIARWLVVVAITWYLIERGYL